VTATRHLPAHLRGDTHDPLLCSVKQYRGWWCCSECLARDRQVRQEAEAERQRRVRQRRLQRARERLAELLGVDGAELADALMGVLAEAIGELVAELGERGGHQ
jgi:hypothetical protein